MAQAAMATSFVETVAAVILSWNHSASVLSCVDRAKANGIGAKAIIVVDNASDDDSVAVIGSAHPDIVLLPQQLNKGFAGGVNVGLREADRREFSHVWILNDDTCFDDHVLRSLLETAARFTAGALVSPLLRDLEPPGADQFRNGLIEWATGRLGHNYDAASFEAVRALGATPILPGTALLCDLRAYRAIGPLDERYFAYWEDVDYCVRAARAGFPAVVASDAVVQHAAPSSDTRPPHYHYYMVRNEALFWHLHADSRTSWRREWLSRALARAARNRDLNRLDEAFACIDAIWHGWRHRYGARDDHRPAPHWLRALALARPYLWSHLAVGDYQAILKQIIRR